MTHEMAERADLGAVSSSSLERLREQLAEERLRPPITRAKLAAAGLKHQLDALTQALAGHTRLACVTILDVALSERAKHDRPAPELVWTGPEAATSTARDTAVVLRGLFESAREQVILAGYSFDHARDVLAPLHQVMVEHGVQATFVVDIKQTKRHLSDPDAYADEQLAQFAATNWPFGEPYPRIYYDRRAVEKPPPWCSMHAKCVVIDGERAFVSSANFTQRGQERNIEAGVLLHDVLFARHLARQWLGLIEAGHVCEWVMAEG